MSKPRTPGGRIKRGQGCPVCRIPGRQAIKGGPCKWCAATAEPEPVKEPERSSLVLDTTLLTLDRVFEIVQAAANSGAAGVVIPLGANEILEKIYDPTSNTSVRRYTYVADGPES